MFDLIIITGASKGIGKNIANKCFDICKTMIAISSSKMIYDIKQININNNCNVIPLQLDLQDYNNVSHQIFQIVSNLNNINSLGIVLCGAQIGEYGGLFESNLNDWNILYKCNVLGNLSIVKGCENIIKSGINVKIVFFAGGGAAFGYPEFSGYSLSKVAVVRSVENLAIDLSKINKNASIIAVSPGAVDTDILQKVVAFGGNIRTKTDISEPTNFVYNFFNDRFPSKDLNGRLIHVRDDIKSADLTNNDLFKLRRIQ